jgi:DNA-binding transcriptional MerR regulator
MRIGELARRTRISERALRYYEEQQLLRPVRRPSGYREYREADVRTVRNIRTLLAAGLNTTTIAEVLPCMVEDGEALAPACPELATILTLDRDRISTAINDLQAARDILDAIIAAAARSQSLQSMVCDPAEAVSESRQPGPPTAKDMDQPTLVPETAR